MNLTHLVKILQDNPELAAVLPVHTYTDAHGRVHVSESDGQCRLNWRERYEGLVTGDARVLLGTLCHECARGRHSITESVHTPGQWQLPALVDAWVGARTWLAKPARCSRETTLRRARDIADTLRWNATAAATLPAWAQMMTTELQSLHRKLVDRLGTREEALAEMRAAVAASVGGDEGLLVDDEMLIVLAGYRGGDPAIEAVRSHCALRRDENLRIEVLCVPTWVTSYLLRQKVVLEDFTGAPSDLSVRQTAVALYDPHTPGPHALLCTSVESARLCLVG